MIASIKDYFYIALGLIVMGFIASYKYMAMKIERQDEEIDSLEAEGEAKDFVADNREAAARAEALDEQDITDGTVRL